MVTDDGKLILFIGVTAIDMTGIEALYELKRLLGPKDIKVFQVSYPSSIYYFCNIITATNINLWIVPFKLTNYKFT